ncbi:MAG: hypothetical protein KKD31_14890 [Bacteroidetes bacterium]|nr:hypothetical protein [Bacteroidota bacterium]
MMKIIKSFVCILVLLLFVNCNNEKDRTSNSNSPSNIPDNNIIKVDTAKFGQATLFDTSKLSKPTIKYAIHRADNDISISADSTGGKVELPEIVINCVQNLLVNCYLEYGLDENETYYKLKDLYKITYMLTFSGGLQLFVTVVEHPLSFDMYYLILFDPLTNKITKEPFEIDGRYMNWSDEFCLIKKPYVTFTDIDSDNQEEVIFQRRAHNGNVYNAVQYLYLSFNTYLNFKNVFVLETMLLEPFKDNPDFIIREIELLEGKKIKVTSKLQRRKSLEPIGEIGFVIYEYDNTDSCYKVIEFELIDDRGRYTKDILIPFSEK